MKDYPTIFYLTTAIFFAIGMFIGFLLCISNQSKKLEDYDNGMTKDIRKLKPVYPSTEHTVFALTNIGDMHPVPNTYILNKATPSGPKYKTYLDEVVELRFIQQGEKVNPEDGIQDEQLARILLDRAYKRHDSDGNELYKEMIGNLELYLACHKKIIDQQKD